MVEAASTQLVGVPRQQVYQWYTCWRGTPGSSPGIIDSLSGEIDLHAHLSHIFHWIALNVPRMDIGQM